MRALWVLIAVVVVSCVACGPSVSATQSFALLVANGDYATLPRLNGPIPETRSLASALKSIGIDVTVVENADRKKMLEALYTFAERMQAQEGVALFYFAGHGVQVEGSDYLIPVDADVPDERRVPVYCLSVDEVLASLGESGADASIIVFDACRDNPLPESANRSLARGLSQVPKSKPRNSLIVYSAQPGALAHDGVFTPALARHITTPGVSITEVLMRVRAEVSDATHEEQVPGEYSELRDPIYLAGPPSGTEVFPPPRPVACLDAREVEVAETATATGAGFSACSGVPFWYTVTCSQTWLRATPESAYCVSGGHVNVGLQVDRAKLPPGSTHLAWVTISPQGGDAATLQVTVRARGTRSLKIIAPAAGTIWNVGSLCTVTWSSVSAGDSLKLEWSFDGGASWKEHSTVQQNDGEEKFRPVEGNVAAKCLLRLTSVEYPTVSATSGVFAIRSLSGARSLSITAPVKGTIWEVGSISKITWSAVSAGDNLKLEWSFDGGASWREHPTVLRNDGEQEFSVSEDDASTQCVVRLTSAEYPTVSATSGVFAISVPPPPLYAVEMGCDWVDPPGLLTSEVGFYIRWRGKGDYAAWEFEFGDGHLLLKYGVWGPFYLDFGGGFIPYGRLGLCSAIGVRLNLGALSVACEWLGVIDPTSGEDGVWGPRFKIGWLWSL